MRIAVYFEFDIISSQNTLRGVTLKDSHGRTIDYLRISLTDRCNFRCVYCMPEEGVCAMSHDEILRIEEIERLVAVAVRSLDQDFLEFAKLSIDRPLHVRFIEYMPVGDTSEDAGTGWGKEDVIPSEELFDIINERARAAGLPELRPAGATKPLGWGPARYFEFTDALGTVGFISPLSRHFCSECNRLRVTADGKVRPCLFSDTEYDVRTALREGDDAAVRDVLLTALGAKPDDHHDKVGTDRKMSQIGG